ncbi:MAG: transposase [Isosphaeraceae bacterium]
MNRANVARGLPTIPMAEKTRERFTAEEKVAILRLHLLEHTPVSDLCDQHGIHPTDVLRLAEGVLRERLGRPRTPLPTCQ